MAGNGLLYGPAMHQAREQGDLSEMRRLASEAEQHIAKYGDVPRELEELKAEIARCEADSEQ
jgi:hypothetical protein